MIRIDFKPDGTGHVATVWVSENGDAHSNMGRLLFTESQFETFRNLMETSRTAFETKFEEKK